MLFSLKIHTTCSFQKVSEKVLQWAISQGACKMVCDPEAEMEEDVLQELLAVLGIEKIAELRGMVWTIYFSSLCPEARNPTLADVRKTGWL